MLKEDFKRVLFCNTRKVLEAFFSFILHNQEGQNMQQGEQFKKALSNFVNDFSYGGAVRHLADQGLTVTEMIERLGGGLSKKIIADMVWQYYLEIGKIVEEIPDNNVLEKVSYVKDTDRYGRTSLRRVVEKVERPQRKYIACDFGKKLYQNKETFEKTIECLSRRDREYIMDLPWPLMTVYHEADERMSHIMRQMGENE